MTHLITKDREGRKVRLHNVSGTVYLAVWILGEIDGVKVTAGGSG